MKIKSIFSRHAGESRCPVFSTDTWGSRIKCGMTVSLRGMTAAILTSLLITPAFATDPDPVAQKTVASKAYVDTKQDIIQTGNILFYDDVGTEYDLYVPGLVAYDSSTGSLKGNQIGILDQETIAGDEGSLVMYNSSNYGAEMDNFVPTVYAVANALQSVYWSPLIWDGTKHPSAINAYSVTFGNASTNWPNANQNQLVNGPTFANALALKQNKITTGLVTFHEPEEDVDYTVPALVSYGTGTNNADGVLGNKIGILGSNESWGGLDSWQFLDISDDSESAYLDNFVPTVRAVASAIQQLQWNSTYSNAINAYSTSFTGTTNNWPADGSNIWLVNGDTFANALALKQNKLPRQTNTINYVPKGGQTITLATSANGAPGTRYITADGSVGLTTKSDAPAIIGYVNGTAVADSTAMGTFTTGTFGANSVTNQKHIKNALVSLGLLKDVYSELDSKITNNALPTGTTGTVVTYNGTNATTGVQEFGERAVYDPANAYNAQNDATKLATAGFVETKQNKMVCAGWDSDTHTDEHCWLWSIE